MRRLLIALAVLGSVLAVAPQGLAQTAPTRICVVGDISPPPNETATNDHKVARLAASTTCKRVIGVGDTQYQVGSLGEYTHTHGWVEAGGFGDPELGIEAKLWINGGNHEGSDPAGYYNGLCNYFGEQGVLTGCDLDLDKNGRPDGVWVIQYAGWTFIGLNSGCGDQAGSPSCAYGSPQYWWLNHVLKYVAKEGNAGTQCTAFVFHEPFKSSPAPFWGETKMQSIWALGVKWNVDVALGGHNHAEEYLTGFRASGIIDVDSGPRDGDDGLAGIRQVVSGGGGRSLIGYTGVDKRSRYRQVKYGIYEMDLSPTSWSGHFRYVDGKVEFQHSVGCH